MIKYELEVNLIEKTIHGNIESRRRIVPVEDNTQDSGIAYQIFKNDYEDNPFITVGATEGVAAFFPPNSYSSVRIIKKHPDTEYLFFRIEPSHEGNGGKHNPHVNFTALLDALNDNLN